MRAWLQSRSAILGCSGGDRVPLCASLAKVWALRPLFTVPLASARNPDAKGLAHHAPLAPQLHHLVRHSGGVVDFRAKITSSIDLAPDFER